MSTHREQESETSMTVTLLGDWRKAAGIRSKRGADTYSVGLKNLCKVIGFCPGSD